MRRLLNILFKKPFFKNLHFRIEPKDHLEGAFAYCKRSNKANNIYIAFFDGNGIKRVNDTFGHLYGDMVIERISNILGNNCRSSDRIIRFGGDEFVVFLGNIDRKSVKEWIKRVQSLVRSDELMCSKVGGISISVGVLESEASNDSKCSELISEADRLMYLAKNNKPTYRVFSSDSIKIVEKLDKRASGDKENLKRDYFDSCMDAILKLHPEWNEEIVRDCCREVWRNNYDSILNMPYFRVLNSIKSKYRNCVKRKVA